MSDWHACEALGCWRWAITKYGDGTGRRAWLCEEHGDALAVGFPLKQP